MKTVWIYVNTCQQVGDHDHLKGVCECRRRGNLVRGERPRRGCLWYEVLEWTRPP